MEQKWQIETRIRGANTAGNPTQTTLIGKWNFVLKELKECLIFWLHTLAEHCTAVSEIELFKCYCFVLGKPVIPKVDMGFAISATAANSKEHFQKMQEVIKTFIDKYGSHRMAYSVMTFGSSPTIHVRFSDSASPDDILKRSVDSIPQNKAQASLDKALYGAKELFKASNGARRDAMKVLVVIADKKSDSLAKDVKKSALRLDESDIRVIGVALGDEGDGELGDITDVKDDVINTTDTTSPTKVVEKIMERVLNSKSATRYL